MNPFVYGRVVSKGEFCPRLLLESQLKSYILSNQNVLVEGERRVGKTSLICETIRKIKKCHLLYVDLLEIKDNDELCRRIIKSLLTMSQMDHLFQNIFKSLANMKPVLSIDPLTGLPSVTIGMDTPLQPNSLEELLNLIYKQSAHKKIVVVFDEFQDILNLPNSSTVLSILRSRIQFQREITYVFSGSIRNKLNDIFSSPDSPFFKSAITISVGALEKDEFTGFLENKFTSGGRTIKKELLDRIFSISQDNPGDIQQLCGALWECSDNGASIDDTYLSNAMSRIFGMEKKGYEAHLSRLSGQQQRCLIGLAYAGGKAPLSAAFLKSSGIRQPSSVQKTLGRLVEMKIIYRSQDEYKFTNPFFKAWLVAENM
jgi:hypothetical protein